MTDRTFFVVAPSGESLGPLTAPEVVALWADQPAGSRVENRGPWSVEDYEALAGTRDAAMQAACDAFAAARKAAILDGAELARHGQFFPASYPVEGVAERKAVLARRASESARALLVAAAPYPLVPADLDLAREWARDAARLAG